jgi:DnaJ-class molecular chaperone
MQGHDIEAEITLTLEEAHRGVKRTLSLQTAVPCTNCGGSGVKDGKPCPVCRGTGTVEQTRTLELTIPAGMGQGSVLRLAGQGDAGPRGAQPGDLLLRVHIAQHPLFQVFGGRDIQIELPVAPWEAALGAKIMVPTLDGTVEMNVKAGTQAGQRLRLRSQGLSLRGGRRGDEYVKIKIVIPPKLTEREKELFQNLAAESHFNARDLLPKRT